MRLRALLVVALLVLAGCSNVAPSGPASRRPTDSVTPAPVPDTEGVSSTDGDRLAPGLTADGIVDRSAPDRAHRSALADRSYDRRTRSAIVSENGTVYDGYGARTTVDARNGTSLHVFDGPDVVHPPDFDRETVWSNGLFGHSAESTGTGM